MVPGIMKDTAKNVLIIHTPICYKQGAYVCIKTPTGILNKIFVSAHPQCTTILLENSAERVLMDVVLHQIRYHVTAVQYRMSTG